jgi:peptidoglycan/xylan/chitin deacetylase (PgdA/CDA1 family)
MMRSLLGVVARRGVNARLTILIFHRVLAAADPLQPDEPDVARFQHEMLWIRRWCNVLPLVEALQRLGNGCLPERAISITFDDGYADNCTLALPILRQLELTATFFISTGFLDGGRMWNDSIIEAVRGYREATFDLQAVGLGRYRTDSVASKRSAISALLRAVKHLDPGEREDRVAAIVETARAALPDDLMMTSEQVRKLHDAGMQIGAHTVSHPILQAVPLSRAEREIADGRDLLEQMIGAPVPVFAYPNGEPHKDYGSDHVMLVRRLGFAGAVSTASGVATSRSDPFQLPRFRPWDRHRLRYGLRLAHNMLNTVHEQVA